MTIEKRSFIKPEDIVSVRVQCTGCGAAEIIPYDKLVNGNIGLAVTRSCPHCNKPSGFNSGTAEMQDLITFNTVLGKLRETLKGRGIDYSFQVECEG